MTTSTAQREDRYPTRGGGVPTTERSHPTVWGTATDGPFSGAELEAHERRGFTILRDFISAEEVTTYSDELTRLAGDESLRSDERVITERELHRQPGLHNAVVSPRPPRAEVSTAVGNSALGVL